MRRAGDPAEAEQARADAARKLREAQRQRERQRDEVRRAANDLAWMIEQSMRRQQ